MVEEGKEWLKDKKGQGDKTNNGQHEDGYEHSGLVACPFAQKVNGHNAYPIEGMQEHGPNQCQRQKAHDDLVKEGDAFIVDGGAKAKQGDVYDMDKEK